MGERFPLQLCGQLRQFKSSDPRDKIYAVADIICDLGLEDLGANYSQAFQDTYLNFARHAMSNSTAGFQLEFLGHVVRFSVDDNVSREVFDERPTWVPD